MEYKREIYKRLPRGQKNAIRSDVLAAELGFSSTRALQKAIEEERRTGALILSGANGYYAPESVEEVRESYFRNRSRATSLLYTLKECRKWLQRNDKTFQGENLEQMSISDFLGEDKPIKTAKVRGSVL